MHRNSNAYAVYQNNQVNTSSSGKLLLMLYDGALKFLRFALIAIEDKNIENANTYLVKTQNILLELMATLNYDTGEIARQLYNLYDYMNRELIDANIHKDSNKVKSVYDLLEELRDTWNKVI